tara:strand:+ start:585 stop:1001 length:417 start_codon:yes stop_codon:yes gene_type:complete
MNKSELKALLKPLIKECIKESLLEGGILSNVIVEVTKGLSTTPLVEHKKVASPKVESKREAPVHSVNERLAEHKKNLMSAIGSDAYGGIDLFEGTTPAPGQASVVQEASPLSGTGPSDAGIDISGIMAVGGNRWKDLI